MTGRPGSDRDDRPVPPQQDAEALDAKFRQALGLQQRGDATGAERLYREVLAADPAHVDALHMLGVVRYQQGRPDEARELIGRAVAAAPGYAAARVNLGLALRKLGRLEDALSSFERALAIAPDSPGALVNRGNLLQDLMRPAEAVASYDRALALRPDFAEAHYNRGNALLDLERLDEALASYDRALQLRPDQPQMLSSRGTVLQALRRHEDAAATFARLLAVAPEHPFTKGRLLHARMQCCDWTDYPAATAEIAADIRAGKPVAEPFGYQGVSESEPDLLACARVFAAQRHPAVHPPLWQGGRRDHARIRIGYLSGEFRQQATSILMAELFERHDRERFRLTAFDNGPADGSEIRRRIESAFDEIVDVTRLDDHDAAAAIRDRGIDILVDLNGYFGRARLGILSHRPCPVQVSYLGFPGTLGVPYVDYIVADAHVIPPGHEAFYDEKVVRLPDAYQPNDSHRRIAERTPTRAEAGLPGAGFVFCCFNNNYKITPAMFDVWMRLLREVPGSVLWLLGDNAAAVRNLRHEAGRRGVAADRLVFAARVEPDEHLARHRLADLFVDTLPYNAHTTASDALWAGLPVLTCVGSTFPGRVAASLLDAAGLPQLVTRSLADYEALALDLARTPQKLAAIRAALAASRGSCALFDSERFRRHLEAAYVAMWERQRRGEPPAAFDVPPLA